MLEIRGNLERHYPDVLTPPALAALEALAPLDQHRRELMAARIRRRAGRARDGQRITFLDPSATIPGTDLRVQDAREGKFVGAEIPAGGAGRDRPAKRCLRPAVGRGRVDVRR
jgi:malate synthase